MNSDGGRLTDKVAMITGGGGGIGRATAATFARNGTKVVLTGRTEAPLQVAARDVEQCGGTALAVAMDVTDESRVREVVRDVEERLGPIDILVNGAGLIHPPISLLDFDIKEWREVVDVNLVGPAIVTKAVLPSMIDKGAGKVINISSIGGRGGEKLRSAYRASKAGLINLTQSVAAEVKRWGIDVTCVCPAATDTEGYWHHLGKTRDASERIIHPQEIADLILFLASDTGSVVSGSVIDAFGVRNPLFQ